MFTLVEKRYKFDGHALKIARIKSGLTQREFAMVCGWSAPYQCRLEQGIHEVDEDKMNTIRVTLLRYKVNCPVNAE